MNAMHFESAPPKQVSYRNGSPGMSRLINAALVDPEFCKLLLTQPAVALSQGFQQETFSLSYEESIFALTIQAVSLADFAAQWVERDLGCHSMAQKQGDLDFLRSSGSLVEVLQGKEMP